MVNHGYGLKSKTDSGFSVCFWEIASGAIIAISQHREPVELDMQKSLRPKYAAEFLSIGIATLWRWSRERPDFPKARRLSARCTTFDQDELIAWRDAQTDVRKAA